MNRNFGTLVGVLCGALVLGGCSREPAGKAEAAAEEQSLPGAAAASAVKVNETLPQTVECLTEAILAQEPSIDAVMPQPREAISAQIPPAELVYWSEGSGFSKVSTGSCEKLITKIVTERSSEVADNHYVVAEITIEASKEIQDSAAADIVTDTFDVFNGVIKRRQELSGVFKPAPKGSFEKTADYEARIAREKAEFEKAHSGKSITPRDVEQVWVGIFGTPYLSTNYIYSEADLYNPDTEMLTLVIRPSVKQQVPVEKPKAGGGVRMELADRYPFEIPVKIKLTPGQAQKFFERFETRDLSDLSPVVAMQMHNGTLTVKEVSLKYKYPDVWKELGFTLDHIPVNQELSRKFLTGQ